jgi:uncharacterized membrane protein
MDRMSLRYFAFRGLAATIFAAVTMALLTSPASAELRVCNKNYEDVYVAVGYSASGEWVSEGWWLIESHECETVVDQVKNRYYYFYAEEANGKGTWDGEYSFCTQDEVFEIYGSENCKSRGLERTGFFETDTGDATDYTLNLEE